MAAFKSGKVDEKTMMKCAGQQAHVYLSQADRGHFVVYYLARAFHVLYWSNTRMNIYTIYRDNTDAEIFIV